MAKRDIAEQIMANYMFNRGLVTQNDDIEVKRLDFKQNFKVFVNKSIIGECEYNPHANRFCKLNVYKAKLKNQRYKAKETYTIIEWLKGKKINILG